MSKAVSPCKRGRTGRCPTDWGVFRGDKNNSGNTFHGVEGICMAVSVMVISASFCSLFPPEAVRDHCEVPS
jgi:hypothetical protein